MTHLAVCSAKRRRVAVLGAASSLGNAVLTALEQSSAVARVLAVDRLRPTACGDKTRFYPITLTSAAAAERLAELLSAEAVDTLVHLALRSAPPRPREPGGELELTATRRLLQGAYDAPALEQLISWSDTLIYGAAADNPVGLSEATAPATSPSEPFFATRARVEDQLERFAQARPEVVLTTLRTAPIVGPDADGYMSRYLAQRLKVTLLGFDPVWQLLHQTDAAAAVALAAERRAPGAYNIVADGVLPLSQLTGLTGGSLRLPTVVARHTLSTLWSASLGCWPAGFLPYLRHHCIADGNRAADQLGFVAACSCQEALAACARR